LPGDVRQAAEDGPVERDGEREMALGKRGIEQRWRPLFRIGLDRRMRAAEGLVSACEFLDTQDAPAGIERYLESPGGVELGNEADVG